MNLRDFNIEEFPLNDVERHDYIEYCARLKIAAKLKNFWKNEQVHLFHLADDDRYYMMVEERAVLADGEYADILMSFVSWKDEMIRKYPVTKM